MIPVGESTPIRMAIAKGRPLTEALDLLARTGISLKRDPNTSRHLLIPAVNYNLEIVVVRGTDVPVYLEYGAVDLGVVGLDILIEGGMRNIIELLDLKLARCKMVVAGLENTPLEPYRYYRVATKYPNFSRSWFYRHSMFIEPIKLYGSVELAPLVDLADLIVDLSGTGKTLAVNNLHIVKEVMDVSTRLMANRTNYKIRANEIDELVEHIRPALIDL